MLIIFNLYCEKFILNIETSDERMMLLCTKCHGVVTGTIVNWTEQEIVTIKRDFRLHPLFL